MLQRGVEREVDVVAEKERRPAPAPGEGARSGSRRLRRLEQLSVVLEVEGAGHSVSTSTSSQPRGRLGSGERLDRRLGDGDHVAAAVSVEPHGTDRLTHLQVRVGLHDAVGGEHGIEAADADDPARPGAARARR